MAERLALDDDHVGILALEGGDDLLSTSPEQNWGTRASRATPYFPPWISVV
jgi:hypothetical protein